jgi:hypothetical protein
MSCSKFKNHNNIKGDQSKEEENSFAILNIEHKKKGMLEVLIIESTFYGLILEFMEKVLIPSHLQFWVFFDTIKIRCKWDLRELIWRMSCITTNRSSLGNEWPSMIGTM